MKSNSLVPNNYILDYRLFKIFTSVIPHLFVGPMNLASVRKDYSLHWHFRNCNHTSEIPKISTRHPQTPIEAIGTQFATFAIQEILKKVLQNTNSGKNWHIDILTYQYWYVKYRGGHYWDFGVSRSTVEFLNNILSVLEVFLFVKRKFSY